MPKPRWAVRIAVCAAMVYTAWILTGWGGIATTEMVTHVGFILFGLFAVGCAVAAARAATGRHRLAVGCFAVGMSGWLVADIVQTWYVLQRPDLPLPLTTNVGYLLLPVGVILALVLWPVGHSGQSRTRLLLDGLIVSGSLFLVSWVLVLQGMFAAGVAGSAAFAVTLAYPILDVVAITIALLMLTRTGSGARAPLVWLLLGTVLMAVSNDIYMYLAVRGGYATGNVLDIGWVASLLAFSFAGVAATIRPFSVEPEIPWVPSRAWSLWPYVPVALSGVVGTIYLLDVASAPVLATAVILVMAVLLRQFLVVSENRRLLVAVADQALRDPLTGLANRILFQDRLAHAVQMRDRDARALGVLTLDLVDFKLVNDSLGHAAGDALLVQVAARMSGCVRSGDTVARLGGDEFAVVLENGPEPPTLIAQQVVESFDAPFAIDGRTIFIRPSVGLAVASTTEQNVTAAALLKQSDAAMYVAKRARTSSVHTFSPGMHLFEADHVAPPAQHLGAARRGAATGIELLGQLRRAIGNGELSVVYQPQVDLNTGVVVRVEALVRWPHPDLGLLHPEQFLPLVRHNGLMDAVTELVLTRAIADAAAWQRDGMAVPVAVNLFAPSFADVNLPGWLSGLLSAGGLPPSELTVEVTEDALLHDVDDTRAVLHAIRRNGVRVAIDDFGSGYSGLHYLRTLPVDEVKIDRQFITPLLDDRRAVAIVRAVVDLAQTLDLTCVAEGVESAQTAARLREYGCDIAQGYHFSRPLQLPALIKLLAAPPRLAGAGVKV